MCDVVTEPVFVKRLVFFGGSESVEERSCHRGCAACIQHKQRRPPMSNVTALISFQCSPGITAGARDRHTSLLHTMRFLGDSTIHKSTGLILMRSMASLQYSFVLSCMLILRSNLPIIFFPPNFWCFLWSLECDTLHVQYIKCVCVRVWTHTHTLILSSL